MSETALFFATNDEPRDVTNVWRRHCALHQLHLDVRTGWKSWEDTGERAHAIRDSKLVIIWNGNDPGGGWVRRVCRHYGTQYVVAEWGFLPQAGHFHLDSSGIVGSSSLCGGLDWVTESHLDALRVHRDAHLGARGWRWRGAPDSFVLVPLQLERDSAMYMYSPFPSNAAFIDHVARQFPEAQIVVRPHPHDTGSYAGAGRVRVETQRSTMDVAQDASTVIGMNSTVLLETALLGVPTVALAPCPLEKHQRSPDEVQRLLAACVARQIPLTVSELDPWLRALGVGHGS